MQGLVAPIGVVRERADRFADGVNGSPRGVPVFRDEKGFDP